MTKCDVNTHQLLNNSNESPMTWRSQVQKKT